MSLVATANAIAEWLSELQGRGYTRVVELTVVPVQEGGQDEER